MLIAIKRVDGKPPKHDGYRVLVDRMWPRGLTNKQARVDAWANALAPSAELRKWFNHNPDKWVDFKERYFEELDEHREAVEQLATKWRQERLMVVFATKSTQSNNAVALKEYFERKLQVRLKPTNSHGLQ